MIDRPLNTSRSTRYVVMGVSGCGKSAIGALLARRLSLPFVEGDLDHPPQNIAKMAAGIPLDDMDRQEWLLVLQARLREAARQGQGMVLSCSALKRRYRDMLRSGDPDLVFIHLDGPRELLAARMHRREGHFMPPGLLDSQLRDLEPPQADERACTISIDSLPEQMVGDIMRCLTQQA